MWIGTWNTHKQPCIHSQYKLEKEKGLKRDFATKQTSQHALYRVLCVILNSLVVGSVRDINGERVEGEENKCNFVWYSLKGK